MAGICIILLLGVPLSHLIKTTFQSHFVGRNPPSVTVSLYQRIVCPKLSKNYESLPDNIKDIITPEDAIQHDSHRNNTGIVTSKLISADPTNHLLNEVSISIIKNDPLSVIKDIGKDFMFNLFVPEVYNIQELYCADTIEWTQSRFSEYTPKLSYFYTVISEIIFWIITIILLGSIFLNIKLIKDFKNIFIVCLMFVFANSAFYAILSNFGFHIRYQLTNFLFQIILMYGTLIWIEYIQSQDNI